MREVPFNLNNLTDEQRILHFEKQGSTSISVAENDQFRWMTINDAVQSVMSMTQKELPVLPHLSAMLMVLYYLPEPKNILELGLGGGSMQRFFKHHFPGISITTVENDATVIKLFNNWFASNDKAADICHDDARQRLTRMHDRDIIVVDLFSQTGSPDFLNEPPFYQQCLKALSDNGLMVINLIVQYQLQVNLILDLLAELSLKVKLFTVPGYQNRILIVSRQKLPKVRYDQRLEAIAANYGLDLDGVIAN